MLQRFSCISFLFKPPCYNKEKYIEHIRTLKQALNQGLVFENVHIIKKLIKKRV